ncbi:MAG TPA: hypothetical protein VGE04_05895 [Chloroflexia bacterium]
MTTPISRPLHLNIAVSSEEPGFTRELRLIKASLLYAEHATIYSMYLEATLPFIMAAQELGRERASYIIDVLVLQELKGAIPINLVLQQANEIHQVCKSGLVELGFKDLAAGLISGMEFGFGDMRSVDLDETLDDQDEIERYMKLIASINDAATDVFIDLIFNSLVDGTSYPLLDETFGGLVSNTLTEVKSQRRNYARPLVLSDEAVKSARETRLAVDLFSRLPTFETASLDEILDIRKELNRPLASFRSEIIKLAEQMHSAPWDKDFPFEAERLVRRDIEPAILHLEEDVRSNSYLAKLAYKSLKDPLEVGGATGLGFLVGSLGGAATSMLGAMVGVGLAALDVYREWQEKKRELERNQVYFFYEAEQGLKRSRRKHQRKLGRVR